MVPFRNLVYATLVLAGLPSITAVAAESADPGRKIFEQRCLSCHEGTPPSANTLGPSLVGIIGRKPGTGSSGVHSRAAIESDMVWTRDSLRRYLSDPGREMPGTIMSVRVQDPKELDDLLNYLQTLR